MVRPVEAAAMNLPSIRWRIIMTMVHHGLYVLEIIDSDVSVIEVMTRKSFTVIFVSRERLVTSDCFTSLLVVTS